MFLKYFCREDVLFQEGCRRKRSLAISHAEVYGRDISLQHLQKLNSSSSRFCGETWTAQNFMKKDLIKVWDVFYFYPASPGGN